MTRSILRCDWPGIAKVAFDEKGLTADDLTAMTPWAFAAAFLKSPDEDAEVEVTVADLNRERAARGERPIIPTHLLKFRSP